MLQTVKVIEPVTENQKAIYPNLLSLLSDFLDSRRDRIRNANIGEPTVEWVILIIGAAITITYTFFFTMESNSIHLIMRGMATLMILMSLYLILLFGTPFSGDLKVSPEPFKSIIRIGSYYKDKVSPPSGKQEKENPSQTKIQDIHDDPKSKNKILHLR